MQTETEARPVTSSFNLIKNIWFSPSGEEYCNGISHHHCSSYIITLKLILRTHDNRSDKGVSLLDTILHTLGYANDASLINMGDTAGIIRARGRLSRIATGSLEDADVQIKIEKTKDIHISQQDPITDTTPVRGYVNFSVHIECATLSLEQKNTIC